MEETDFKGSTTVFKKKKKRRRERNSLEDEYADGVIPGNLEKQSKNKVLDVVSQEAAATFTSLKELKKQKNMERQLNNSVSEDNYENAKHKKHKDRRKRRESMVLENCETELTENYEGSCTDTRKGVQDTEPEFPNVELSPKRKKKKKKQLRNEEQETDPELVNIELTPKKKKKKKSRKEEDENPKDYADAEGYQYTIQDRDSVNDIPAIEKSPKKSKKHKSDQDTSTRETATEERTPKKKKKDKQETVSSIEDVNASVLRTETDTFSETATVYGFEATKVTPKKKAKKHYREDDALANKTSYVENYENRNTLSESIFLRKESGVESDTSVNSETSELLNSRLNQGDVRKSHTQKTGVSSSSLNVVHSDSDSPNTRTQHKENRNDHHNNEITLDMLSTASTVSINDLSKKIVRDARKGTPSKVKQTDMAKSKKQSGTVKSKKTTDLAKSKESTRNSNNASNRFTALNEDESDVDDNLEALNEAGMTSEPSEKEQQIASWLKSLEDEMSEAELDFEPSILHKSQPLLKGLLKKDRESLVAEGIKFRFGTWTTKEDVILKRNLGEFCKKYKVPDVALILGIGSSNKEHQAENLKLFLKNKNFSFELGKDLPLRTLFTIYKRARTIFNPYRVNSKEKLSKTELNMVFRFQAKKGNKWTTLSEIMKKPAEKLYEAARYHSERKEMGEWTAEENEKLLKAVKRKMKSSSDGQFKQLPWKKISKSVGTRSADTCRKQWMYNLCWKFHHGEKPKPKWTVNDSWKLISYLYNTDADCEADVDWNELFQKFKNLPSYSTLIRKWHQLRRKVANYEKKDFEDNVLYLHNLYQEKMKNKEDLNQQVL